MPVGTPDAVYHGPTTFIPLTYDPYTAPKRMGIFQEVEKHAFQHVNAGEIVDRILRSREAYEARQRAKFQKGVAEDLVKAQEQTLA
jgi:ethanolamine-phosphate cytidylyltransferase